MLRLHVRHVIAFFAQILERFFLHRLQVMNNIRGLELEMRKDLDEVLAPDPFIDQLILFQDVDVNAWMTRVDAG